MRDYNCDSCGVSDEICDPHLDCVADVWHAALKSVERHKTVRAKRPVQQRKADICPKCNGDGIILNSTYRRNNGRCDLCGGSGKRSAVA